MSMGIWAGASADRAQTATIKQALQKGNLFARTARVVRNPELRSRLKAIKYAYLNRACELASVPLAQHYCEIQSNLDLAWVTYRAQAVPGSSRSLPDAMIMLGYVDEMSEDQARNRALGW